MAKHATAQEVYDMLVAEDWDNNPGTMTMNLLNIPVIINDKSLVGYAMQNWLAEYLYRNDIYFRVPDNSQEFPDFYLSDSDEHDLLELKTFDADAGPNFDIANFDSYCRSVRQNKYRLDADYLIISYTLHNGHLRINNIWLKKIWEISCASESYPIKVQQKQKMIYNLRPAAWDSPKARYKPFTSKAEFINALYKTKQAYKPMDDNDAWYADVMTAA